MSGIIYFSSGKTLEITEEERSKIAPKLQNSGVKLYRCGEHRQTLIPLNSNTMEMIEFVPEPEVEEEPVIVHKETSMGISQVSDHIVEDKQDHQEAPKESTEEKQKRMMDDLIAKSNCKHEDQSLYIQHTAKGIRYFPVCLFCGKRERFVSEKRILDGEVDQWGPEDIKNAKVWVEV